MNGAIITLSADGDVIAAGDDSELFKMRVAIGEIRRGLGTAKGKWGKPYLDFLESILERDYRLYEESEIRPAIEATRALPRRKGK